MRNAMLFPKGNEEYERIISKDKPIDYDRTKKVVLFRGIKPEEYDEVQIFIRDQNKMASGNYTLLPKSEIERYLRIETYCVLMRGEGNSKLYGTIFSIPFPIRCSLSAGIIEKEEYTKNIVVTHGCTTFLNMNSKIRKLGLSMHLIRELSLYGHENNIYCSYQLTPFKLCENSFEVSAWYRPINLIKALSLGFPFKGFNELNKLMKNKMAYKCKTPKGYNIKRVLNKNKDKALSFYKQLVEDKKFVFYPSDEYFFKWIQEFPTYLVQKDKLNVGIYSLKSVYCKMGETDLDGTLCLPAFFNSIPEEKSKVLKCLISTAEERQFDVLYLHSVGDLDPETLKSANSTELPNKSWFSLYNNSIILKPEDIHVPLF